MRHLLLIITCLISISSYGQEVEQNRNKNLIEISNSIDALNIKSIQQQSNIEKNNLELNNLQIQFNDKFKLHEERLTSKMDKLETKINYYLIFGSALLAISVFLINFFGRKLIKERVEVLIERKATEYAKIKTDELLAEYTKKEKIEKLIKDKGEPAVQELLKELRQKGIVVIENIQQRGNEVISSMIAQQEIELVKKIPESDEEIVEAKIESRVREFFDLAYTRKDPLVQIELYKNVLELEPNHIEALNNIGVSYINSYGYDVAIEYLTKCVENSPEFGLAYSNLANAYNQKGDLDKALEFANIAIQKTPNNDWGYVVKGNVLTKKGELDEAEKIFGLAIKLNPKSPEAYVNRGFFYEEIKEYGKSENDYNTALELGFSNKAMLHNNFAVLYRRQKMYDKAIEHLEIARGYDPNFPNIDGTLALIYADRKDRDNFYKYLVIALEKGCPAWNYLSDPGFDEFREEEKLEILLESYKKKYAA
jgi:tetratricopeptide (TPR) repeat protein